MSSRNARLSAGERSRALALPAALRAAEELVAMGELGAGALVECAAAQLRALGVEPEYVALVDPDTLDPLEALSGRGLLALAARVGDVRLIDNALLEPREASTPRQPQPGRALA
jgi:pantoate--beta-alanine ligase